MFAIGIALQAPQASGPYSFSDPFTRGDNPVGATGLYTGIVGGDFASASAFSVLSNQAGTFSFVLNGAIVTTATHTFANNQQAVVKAAVLGSSSELHALARFNATGSGYSAATDGATGAGHTRLIKYVAGVATEIKAVATTIATADTFGINVNGTTISFVKNGTIIDSVVDATYSAGQPGCAVYGGTSGAGRLDDFVASE